MRSVVAVVTVMLLVVSLSEAAFCAHLSNTSSSNTTSGVTIDGNIDAATAVINVVPFVSTAGQVEPATTVTFGDLNEVSEFNVHLNVLDENKKGHVIFGYFFHTAKYSWTVNFYASSIEVDPVVDAAHDLPRLIGGAVLEFNGSGLLIDKSKSEGLLQVPWNFSTTAQNIKLHFSEYTQYAAQSNVHRIVLETDSSFIKSDTKPETAGLTAGNGSLFVDMEPVTGGAVYEVYLVNRFDRRVVEVPANWIQFKGLPRGLWSARYRIKTTKDGQEIITKYSDTSLVRVTR